MGPPRLPYGHRRSIRLPHYDYRGAGLYFVTLCTYDRACLFGDVRNGMMRLNEIGRVVALAWQEVAARHPWAIVDESVVMPNHLHGIIQLTAEQKPGLSVALAAWRAQHPSRSPFVETPTRPRGPQCRSLGAIVGSFKSVTTKQVNLLRASPAAPVWQRGYFERIIGDDATLAKVRRYIASNPCRWSGP